MIKQLGALVFFAVLISGLLLGAQNAWSDSSGGNSYRAFLGDSEAIHVDIVLVESAESYRVKRISTPKSTIARAIADKLTEESFFEAEDGYFRSKRYVYTEEGKQPKESVLGDDNTVRTANGKLFIINPDDILLDMGSLQYVFQFLDPTSLINKTVKVMTHKRVDEYRFSEVTTEHAEVQDKGIRELVVVRADDVHRPGRYSVFWLDKEDNYLMVKMKQQSEKKRLMFPDYMLLELML